jgi:YqaJ-like viral recombinase domain
MVRGMTDPFTFHDVKQNSEEWYALRLGKATASNFSLFMANEGKAFGDPAKRYAIQLALESITGKRSENGYSNEHMERGHEQEPIARSMYEMENFVDVTNGGFFDCGKWGDSPDGLVEDDGVVEIKSVTAPVHHATLVRGSFDPAYRWQLIGHLDCTNRVWVDFASYCDDFPEGAKLIVHRIWAKDVADEIKRLRERRNSFIELIQESAKPIIERLNLR